MQIVDFFTVTGDMMLLFPRNREKMQLRKCRDLGNDVY